MTTPQTFRKPDVVRAIQAAEKANLTVAELRFHPNGGFSILTADSPDLEEHNPWDDDDDEA